MKKSFFAKGIFEKHFFMGIFILLLFLLTGCGYTAEEKAVMKRYEKQGKENAQNYIQEKYGFKPKIKEIKCVKAQSWGIDFSPSPTGDVCVKMSYDDREFDVHITGEEESLEGLDNYQMNEITEAFFAEMENLTGLRTEQEFLCYGAFTTMWKGGEGNGMVHALFAGNNLRQVLEEKDYRAVCSYIDEDLSAVGEKLEDAFEEGRILLVSYNSKEAYAQCESPSYNIAGTPIELDIEKQELFVREYYLQDKWTEDAYVVNDVREHDGFYYTVEAGKEACFTQEEIDEPDNWNSRGYLGAEQVMESYKITTDASYVRLYIPYDRLWKQGGDDHGIALQYYDEEKSHKRALTFSIADDTYLEATIYMRDYEDMRFTVLVSTE